MRLTHACVAKHVHTYTCTCACPLLCVCVRVWLVPPQKLSKDVKTLNKAVRNYEVYRQLEESCKAMLTSLPLVQELHHPAMRERHWQLLMQVRRCTGAVPVVRGREAPKSVPVCQMCGECKRFVTLCIYSLVS